MINIILGNKSITSDLIYANYQIDNNIISIESNSEIAGLELNVDGNIIIVSQFTLHAKTKKGNRPSYIKAAKPEKAISLYEQFKLDLSIAIGKEVQSGEFGANMQVLLTNDGPITIIIDTKNKE